MLSSVLKSSWCIVCYRVSQVAVPSVFGVCRAGASDVSLFWSKSSFCVFCFGEVL